MIGGGLTGSLANVVNNSYREETSHQNNNQCGGAAVTKAQFKLNHQKTQSQNVRVQTSQHKRLSSDKINYFQPVNLNINQV